MGAYDDLIPGPAKTGGGGSYDDLVPVSPEDERRERLRRIALAAMKQRDGEPGADDIFGSSFTLGLQKPVGGLARALGGELGEYFGGEPASFGERYTAETGARQDFMDEARRNSGWTGTAADLAGSVTTGGPAGPAGANLVKQAAQSLPKMIGWNALFGGVEGAAENSENLGDAVKGGIEGAGTSAATTGILGGLLEYGKRLLPGSRAERAIEREMSRGPDPDAIRKGSREMFKRLDDAGIAYDLTQSSDLADTIMTDLVHGGGGWDPEGAHKVLGGVVKRIEGMRGQPLSLDVLQQIRSQAGANARDQNPAVREAAGRILRSIEGFVQNVEPAQTALSAGETGPIWAEARKLWKTANTIDDIDWRVDKAGRRAASTSSGQNEENAIRQNIRSVVDKATQPGRFNPYNPAEIAQMERVVRGTPAQNALRSVGNYASGIAPSGVAGTLAGIGTMLGMGGQMDAATGLLTSGAALGAGAVPMVAGRKLKDQATRMAQDEADSLVRLMATGSLDALPRVPRQGPPEKETLARLMTQRNAISGLGRFLGGL